MNTNSRISNTCLEDSQAPINAIDESSVLTENGFASGVPTESSRDQPLNGDCENRQEIMETSLDKEETALENLAKNLEKNGKYKDLGSEVTETDMIAFKVLTPDFVKSDYVIGLVEAIIGKTTPEREDYDLSFMIMGKNRLFALFCFK